MSRLIRYKDSLNRFIRDRSCLSDALEVDDAVNNNSDAHINTILYNKMQNCDCILPIIMLTIMNNQNKKRHISMQGYYMAACIKLLHVLMDIINSRFNFTAQYGDIYNEIILHTLLHSYKSLTQNMRTVYNSLSPEHANDIFLRISEIYNETISFENLLSTPVLTAGKGTPKDDLVRWYLKNDPTMAKEFENIKKVDDISFQNFMKKKLFILCKFTFLVGWVIGCGDKSQHKKIERISEHFASLYMLYIDFNKIDDDIMNHNNGISQNYVINNGLQKSYELFLEKKQKFIEETMKMDIFTTTIKEILAHIETQVDQVIENTSPDLKSSYSCIMSVGSSMSSKN